MGEDAGQDAGRATPADRATWVVGEDAAMTEEKVETAEAIELTDAADAAVMEDAAPTDDVAAAVELVDSGNLVTRRGFVAALAAALIAALAGVGVLGWQAWRQHQVNQARTEAQQAAVSYAQVLTSIDSNQVDDNFRQVLDGATGDFKDMYSKSSVELRQLLIENKATAHGVVVESAVQSVSQDKAVVLLFVDQSVSNMKLPDPRIDRSRMKMTLEKVEGRWRASKIELP